jgi:hypothetical protein
LPAKFYGHLIIGFELRAAFGRLLFWRNEEINEQAMVNLHCEPAYPLSEGRSYCRAVLWQKS